MEESDLDLLFLSILLLLTVVLSISLRLHALHSPNKGFKKKLDITPLPKEVPGGDVIIRSPPSASSSTSSPGAASVEEENIISGLTCSDNYLNPGFLEPCELLMKSRATFVEVVATRMCSASEIISKRQIVRDFGEKVMPSKLGVDLGTTSEDPKRLPQPPANLCFGFLEGLQSDAESEPRFIEHPGHQVLIRWLVQAAFGHSSTPRLTWSRSWMICNSELIKVTSGDINMGALPSGCEKIHLPISEVGVGDDETTDGRSAGSLQLANIPLPAAAASPGINRITAR